MPSNHFILSHPLLLPPAIFPSIRVFSNESALHIRWPRYWNFSFSISPSSEHPGLISFRMDWLDLLAVQGTLKSLLQHHSSKASILQRSAFFTRTAHALYETFRTQVVEPYLRVWRAYVYRVALDVLLPARDAAAEARIRNGKLNYEDLLLKARDLLRDNLEVRRYFRRRFPYLFVDEFQDTDPIQAEVMLLLAGESDTERDWRRMRPRPGARFVVGDPKQSIYRFHRADIETYNHVRQLIEQGGGRIAELTRNYRSAGRLCDWVNEVFRDTFPDIPTPQQPAFVGLDPNRPPGDAQRTGVRTLTTPEHEDYTSVPGLEADAIARYIADAVRNRRTIEGGSADTKGPRPARYGDFLILTRVKRK